MTPGKPEYHLHLVAEPGNAPAVVRLRRALKQLWRGYRLRCRAVEEVKPPGEKGEGLAAGPPG